MKLPEHLEQLKQVIKQERESKSITIHEIAVIQTLTSGLSNREAAKELCLSVKTIEKHRSNLYKKLGINNVVDLTHYAISKGLTKVKLFV